MPLLISSIDLEQFIQNMDAGRFSSNSAIFVKEAKALESIGAECIAICANTPHLFAADVQGEISVPLLHIADSVAKKLVEKGIQSALLLGTKFTMNLPFYAEVLGFHGIKVMLPSEDDQAWIHQTITNELTHNLFLDDSRARYLSIIADAAESGAQGAILGCTEIPILLKGVRAAVPLFDTAEIHCKAILDFALPA